MQTFFLLIFILPILYSLVAKQINLITKISKSWFKIKYFKIVRRILVLFKFLHIKRKFAITMSCLQQFVYICMQNISDTFLHTVHSIQDSINTGHSICYLQYTQSGPVYLSHCTWKHA